MADDEAYAKKAVESLKVVEVAYDVAADPQGYFKVFKQFDADLGGSVDTMEMAAMVEALGLLMKPADIKKMVEDADEDKSGEIEFGEFVLVMNKAAAQGATTAGGVSFAALIARQKNSVKMEWRDDRVGSNITIDKATMTASKSGGGFSVALLSPWMPGDTKRAHARAPPHPLYSAYRLAASPDRSQQRFGDFGALRCGRQPRVGWPRWQEFQPRWRPLEPGFFRHQEPEEDARDGVPLERRHHVSQRGGAVVGKGPAVRLSRCPAHPARDQRRHEGVGG